MEQILTEKFLETFRREMANLNYKLDSLTERVIELQIQQQMSSMPERKPEYYGKE